jgi:deferrochelatase/peroxidase EfeB
VSFFRIFVDFLEKVRIKSSLSQSGVFFSFLFFSFFQFCDIKNSNFFSKMSQIHTKKTKSQFFPNFFVKKMGKLYFLLLTEKTLIANVFKSKMLPIFLFI